MPEKIDLNISPYYDDYDESKKFHKVLYRAGRPLQARELTQSQSIMQNQIERFGNHVFEEGSIVSGAIADIDMDIYYVKCLAANPGSGAGTSETHRVATHGLHVQGKTSGVVARVMTSVASTGTDELTLLVKFIRQGTTATNDYAFSAGEVLEPVTISSSGSITATASGKEFTIAATSVTPIGRSSIAHISEGIIYTRGFFTKVDTQELILEKYSGKPSYRIGVQISENLISSADDTSLLDNAAGSSNENAGGADRLKLSLTFTKVLLSSTTDSDFIELVRVNNGIIELKIDKTRYTQGFNSTLARRTFDASGDFVTRQFVPNLKEHLNNGVNAGYYSSLYGGNESKFIMQVSPGKAYVKGYEIEKIGTTPLTFKKARSTEALVGASTPIRIGNFIKLKNVHSMPEFGNETGGDSQSPFNEVKIFDGVIASGDAGDPTAAGNHIGYARVRGYDFVDNSSSATGLIFAKTGNAQHNLYMFDVKMFTKLPYGSKTGTFTAGDIVTGTTTGATGIVHNDVSNSALYLHDVVGTFADGEAVTTSGVGTGAFTIGAGVRGYNIDRARSVTQVSTASRETFTANIVTDSDKILLGTVNFNGTTAVSGFGTDFKTELKEGDIIVDGAGTEHVVSSIASAISLTLDGNSTEPTYSGNATRRRTKVYQQDRTVGISALPRDWISNHTPDDLTVRRQNTVSAGSTGFAISVGSGETFGAVNNDNFTVSVAQQSSDAGRTLVNGDTLDINQFSVSGTGTYTFTSGSWDAQDAGAILRVSYTVKQSNPARKTKNFKSGRVVTVTTASSSNTPYGRNYDDKDITLGVADAYKVHGIYEGVGGSTPVPPSLVINETNSTSFTSGEIVIGTTSSARGTIIAYGGDDATSYIYYTGTNRFVAGEVITGQTSSATGTLTSVAVGSSDITNRFFFDDGQRDGFYDIARLTRKSGEPAPSNAILVVFDYFASAGEGNFYDINSYDIPYKDIPVYTANKVDLGGLEPDGTYELSDSIDYRPVVGQLLTNTNFSNDTGSNNGRTVADPTNISTEISSAPFLYTVRDFGSTGSSKIDTPVNGTFSVGDISFYVGRIDKVFLHREGSFQIVEGTSSITPTKPKAIDDAIELFEVSIPAYTKDLKTVKVRAKDHRSYTMKDIGKIANRVANLERVTTLSLLEKDTQSLQILDSDGFDRFKSGFVVDSFKGHGIGDVRHPDYRCAVDAKTGTLRPQSYQNFIDLTLDTTTSSNYQKTGDLITLPYTSYNYVSQDKASRTINVNPYNVFAFIGNVKLTPAIDIWNDSERLPDVRVNRQGNFDAVLAENTNSLGSVWNSWQTTFVGEPTVVSEEVTSTTAGRWEGDPTQGGTWVAGEQVTREITETPETQTRSGIKTTVVEDFVENRNDRVVSVTIIPWIRSREIEIDATELKPNSNHFIFFDNQDVNAHVRPYSATYSQDGGVTVSSGIKADGNGRVRAYFTIPQTDSMRFPTGQRQLRVTSSLYNLSNPASSGNEIYQAQGLLQASQTEITSTRNGRVIRESLGESKDTVRRGESLNSTPTDTTAPEIPVDTTPQETIPDPVIADFIPDLWEVEDFWWVTGEGAWRDPLAQSFLVEKSGGMFVTGVDLYFETKDDSLPVTVELRNMVNGYPGQNVLPFSTKTLTPAEINTSTNGSALTTFTFDSPVFLESQQEYCFVVLSNSDKYHTYISRMGEKDLITSQTIAGQPYAGSLFMSQNASTWTAEQTDDLKFNIKVAKFTANASANIATVNFENIELPTIKLQSNPIQTFVDQRYVKVYAYNHGMYDNSSQVILSGIIGDKTGGVTNVGTPAKQTGTTPADQTWGTVSSPLTTTTSGTGTGATVSITVSSSGTAFAAKVVDCGSGYSASDTLTVTDFGSATNSFNISIGAIEDTLGGFPISLLNGTHSALSSYEIDAFTIIPEVSASAAFGAMNLIAGFTGDNGTVGGSSNVTSTRNLYFDACHTLIPNLQVKDTKISVNIKGTGMNTPEGFRKTVDSVYVKKTSSKFITLNDNNFFDSPTIIASGINESGNMNSTKSFQLQVQLQTNSTNLSPVIDTASVGFLGITNRINNIDSATGKKYNGTSLSSTVTSLGSGTTFVPSTAADGDNNVFTYLTKKINLKSPATSLKTIMDVFRGSGAEVKVLYKILKNDESISFDDIGWTYFNTNGSPDETVEADGRNFKEYEFTVNDLPEFSSFAIKIVGQSYNTGVIPMVSNFRTLALAT